MRDELKWMTMKARDRDESLINPRPNSASARAREFGVDLTLTLSNLRLTPEGRLLRLEQARELLKEIQAARAKGPMNGRS